MSSLALSRAGRLNLRAAEDLFPSPGLTSSFSYPHGPAGLTLQYLLGRNALLFDIYSAMHIHGRRNTTAPRTAINTFAAAVCAFHFGTNRAFVLRSAARISL